MTPAEWDRIAVVLDYGWPGDFDEVASAAYFALLMEQPAAAIEAACRTLTDAGQRFRPTPAELVKAAGRANAGRRQVFLSSFRFCEERYGRKRAIEFLDPRGELVEHYPSEALNA